MGVHVVYPVSQIVKRIYCKFENFREGFIFLKLHSVKMKSSRNDIIALSLLMYVNHTLVLDFKVANMSVNAIPKK